SNSPAGRGASTFIFDVINNRMTVFGGQKVGSQPANNETWILNWAADRPPGVTFANPASGITTASFGSPGNYVLRLTASNAQGTGSGDTHVNVLAQNGPPSVNAGAPVTLAAPGSAQLSGQASDDGLPLGSTLTMAWS